MNDQRRDQSGSDCSPSKDPADQPHLPTGKCDDWPTADPPKPKDPDPCPPPDCGCPPKPGAGSNCLEDLIAAQAKQLTAGDKAKTFKTDLEAVLAKAKAASQDYTRDKYDKLVKEWVKQDADIVELIRKLVCAVPCWKCVIECFVCPLLNAMRFAEQKLYGDGTLYAEAHNLYDLQYWYERDLDAKQRRFDRIKQVMAAWEKPATTIDKALADDAKLISDAGKALGSEPSKVVYDVFLKLVPMHLAIAPPKGPKTTTGIGKEYTSFCGCDVGKPDDCCGPDVGEWSLRGRLIGPQPYLIDPNYFFNVICCLVEKRYGPAKDALALAEAMSQDADAQIKRYKAQVDNGLKSFDKDARGAIPTDVECCGDKLKPGETDSPTPAAS